MTLTYKVTRQGYSVGLCCIEFPDLKNHGNKKKFIAVACLQPEIGTDVGDVMTAWRHGVMSSTCNYHHFIGRRESYWYHFQKFR